MRISKISIHNYRSFPDISIALSPYTAIIGQNNVGKSNILKALELFFNPPFLLPKKPGVFRYRKPFKPRRSSQEGDFDYEKDFPVVLQGSPGQKLTHIGLTFALDQRDFDKLGLSKKFEKHKTVTMVQIIKIEKGKPSEVGYKSRKLTEAEKEEFSNWLFDTADFVRIPSSRKHAASQRLLKSFSNRIHSALQASYKVKKSLENLAERAKKEMRKAEKEICKGLVQFIPELKSITLDLSELPEISDILAISNNIKIDDGTLTFLANKGDGVQSLFFMGLMQYVASLKVNRNLIFGIEEPELHLHPDAQQKLSKTLRSMSEQNQVILTTHSTELVIRSSGIGKNIVIEKGEGSKGIHCIDNASLRTIRKTLGVKPSSNLSNALLVIVVEGTTEKRLVEHIIKAINLHLGGLIDTGELKIEHARGASGATDYLEHLKNQLQPCVAIFDFDKEGIENHEECLKRNILDRNDLFIVSAREHFRGNGDGGFVSS